jgi:hypothetical protein
MLWSSIGFGFHKYSSSLPHTQKQIVGAGTGAFIMRKSIAFSIILSLVPYFVVHSQVLAGPVNPSKESALNYTGTFLTKNRVSTSGYPKEVVLQPTFLAQRLSGNRLKFLVFSQGGGIHNDHLASLEGIVKLHNGWANFKQGTYVLNIRFHPGKAILSESGNQMDAGFGEGSGVSGLYLLKSAVPPNFSRAEKEWGIEQSEIK